MANPAKFHPNLERQLRAQAVMPAAQQQPLGVIVKYRASASVAALSAVPGITATRHAYRLIPAAALTATRDAIDQLSERDDVELIWYDQPVHTLLDVSVPLINAPALWQNNLTGKGIKVCVVDTGMDTTHPDFAGRIAQFRNFTDDRIDKDGNGHGTHVAGIIGGSGAASNGKYKGVAYECTFYAAKVLDSSGSGTEGDVIAGVEWGVQVGAQAMNLSLGADGACDGTDAMSVACDAAVASGVVMCVAAGNAGPSAYSVGSPGCARNVITVGATNKLDQIAYFSSRGPTADGRIKPDLCMPGVDIISCRAFGTSGSQNVGDYYTISSGTSMATPHATGACALLLQAKPGSSPQTIKNLLMSSAKNLGLDPNTQGAGRADVFAAYQVGLRGITNVTFSPTSLGSGQLLTISVTIRNEGTTPLDTEGPEPGFIYEEGDTYLSRGFPDVKGAFRIAIDYDGRTGLDHPYRWGLGTPIMPGETRTITGAIRVKNIQTRNYWAGLVQEQVGWIQDRQGTQVITVNPAIHLVSVAFSPTTVAAGQLLNVSITVRNDGGTALQSQGPEPGFVYEEGDTFASRGFPSVTGNYRVGVEFDGRGGVDHPYRWGFGATPLGAGETRTITGAIRLRSVTTRNYWVGLVQEYVAWLQDRQGVQSIAVVETKPKPQIVSVTFSPTTVDAGQYMTVSITVRNDGDQAVETQGPEPGLIYEEGETFASRGYASIAGKYRVGIDFDGRSGIDHPYRWGLGTALAPGETRTITGSIRLTTPQAQNYWAGLVHEYIAWEQDRQGVQLISVAPGIRIVSVTLTPTALHTGEAVNVSITVRNGSNQALPTQGPEPGFAYVEGDTFATRGFPDAGGNYRVGIDFDKRTGIDHPYRWGFGTPLAPGETRTITGTIRLNAPQAQKFWAGLVHEHIAWLQDREGTTTITVS